MVKQYLQCPKCNRDLKFTRGGLVSGRLLRENLYEPWYECVVENTNERGEAHVYCPDTTQCGFVVPYGVRELELTKYLRYVNIYLQREALHAAYTESITEHDEVNQA